jgi:hypothetical protein
MLLLLLLLLPSLPGGCRHAVTAAACRCCPSGSCRTATHACTHGRAGTVFAACKGSSIQRRRCGHGAMAYAAQAWLHVRKQANSPAGAVLP